MSAAPALLRVGIIGVGALGLAIAERLRQAGLDVCGYRRSSLQSFAALGGAALPSARAVALAADPVLLLLPNDAALLEVLDEIGPVLRSGQTLACLGTHPIAIKRQAQQRADAAGAWFLEGEVSGTPDMIRGGKGSLMVTGEAAVVEAARAVLEAAVGPMSLLDSFGDAARVKLIANYLVSVHTLAAADALIMGRRLGLAPEQLLRALLSSAAASTMLAVRGPMMVRQALGEADTQIRYSGHSGLAGFLRYFELLRDSLREDGAEAGDLLDLVERLYRRTVELDPEAQDLTAIYQTLRGVSGSSTVD